MRAVRGQPHVRESGELDRVRREVQRRNVYGGEAMMQGGVPVLRILHVGPSNRRRVAGVIRRHTNAGEAEADQMVRRTPTELEGGDETLARELEEAGAVIEMSAPTGVAPRRRLFLEDAGSNKIAVIKAIREHTGLGLKESKDIVDGAPREVVEWDDIGRVERFRQALIAAGATVR